MKSTFLTLYMVIFTVYLTGTNAAPGDINLGPGTTNFNGPTSTGDHAVQHQTVYNGVVPGNQHQEEIDPICDGEEKKKICTCPLSYQGDPLSKCTRGNSTFPKNLFCFADKRSCFKFIQQKANWEDADEVCKKDTAGLELAGESTDPVRLRSYLLSKYGKDIDSYTWLGAKGTGHLDHCCQKWKRTNKEVSADSSNWHINEGAGSHSNCLVLVKFQEKMKEKQEQPYETRPCRDDNHVLCEFVRG